MDFVYLPDVDFENLFTIDLVDLPAVTFVDLFNTDLVDWYTVGQTS